jgi:predicted ATPase
VDTTKLAERSSRFVGRADELELLFSELELAGSRSSRLVLVHGESGIGKTRLMMECALSDRLGSATVLSAACFAEQAAPYGPWVTAVGDVLGRLSPRRRGPRSSIRASPRSAGSCRGSRISWATSHRHPLRPPRDNPGSTTPS